MQISHYQILMAYDEDTKGFIVISPVFLSFIFGFRRSC